MPATLNQPEKRELRRIAHSLKPVVTIAANGLSETVLAELNRALNDHELIKVRITAENRETRKEITEQMLTASNAILVQRVGNICVLLRRVANPNPRLSNLIRGGRTT